MNTTLMLLRHGKSSWRDPLLDDFDRPLSGRGVRDGTSHGRRLARALPPPDLVLCSPARRTRDTLAFLVPKLVDPRCASYEQTLYHASAAALLQRIRAVPEDVATLLLVGHDPGLTDLVNLLRAPEAGAALGKLPTFACARFALTTTFARLEPQTADRETLLRPRDRPPKETPHD